jgi:prepilin-type processing-associated H-X9-DG protein
LPAPNKGTFGSCGGSPAGDGIGGPFAPAGYNSTGSPTGTNSDYLQYAFGYPNGETNAADRLSFSSPTGRHQGGANYVLADGHVAYLLPNTVSPGRNAAAEGSNQIDDDGTGTPHAAGTLGYFSDGKTPPSATFSIY